MNRRDLTALLAGAAVARTTIRPLGARAQQPGRLPTIGFLGANTPSIQSQWTEAFVQHLRELGWVEGSNVTIEYRWAEGRSERSAAIIAEFVKLKVDVIVTHAIANAVAAKQGTSVIPIVLATVADPVGTGLVASLARPGGNITGLSNQSPDHAGKRLELLREVVPDLRRLAILANVGRGNVALEIVQVEADQLVNINRVLISRLALDTRLATVSGFREFVDAGGLMSYGANLPDLFRRAADLVDKILHGAKPADIPVEQPTKFDLILNLNTAKALGLEIPQTLLARADEVIE